MARRTRRKVDTFRHGSLGIDVDIYLDGDMKFSAEYSGIKFENHDGIKLRAAIRAAIEEANQIEWVNLMSIKHVADDCEHFGELRLQINRFYAARRGRFIYSANEAAYDHELERERNPTPNFPNRGPFPLRVLERASIWHDHPNREGGPLCYTTHSPKTDDGKAGSIHLDDDKYEIVMPFNQALWDGLFGILHAIKAANKRIRELVGTPQGLALISSGQITLMGSTQNDSDKHPALHASEDLPKPKVQD